MSERWTVSRLEDVPGYAAEGQPTWHMLRLGLGIEAFGVNAWTATAAGQAVVGEHDEVTGDAGAHEELYVVVSGHATFTVDGEEVAAPAGSLVFVRDPTATRAAVGDELGTTVLVIGGRPGEAFVPSRWEVASEALRYWTTGEWDSAAELLRERAAADPENATVRYNLACAESRAGRRDDALRHLEEAIALRPAFAESAPGDPDLAAVRDDPRFPAAPGAP